MHKNIILYYSFAEENYLKAIYKIAENGDEFITTNDVATHLKTSAASVTDMLKKLSRKNLIYYRKYYGLKLSKTGRGVAVNVIRKHRLWEMFLVKILEFKWDEVHDIAEQLEHIRSDKLVRQLDKYLGFPKTDPHGDPIPDSQGKFIAVKEKPTLLSAIKQGSGGVVVGVADHSISFLQFLDQCGIMLGVPIMVKEIRTYDKSMNILLNKKKTLFISNQLAKNILISNDKRRGK